MAKYQQYDDYKDIQNKWISSVPSDWKVVPLKALCLNPVKDGPHETPIFIDEGIPFLSVDGIQNNQLVFEGCRYISEQDHEKYSRKCVPAKGDVLLGKAASVGKVAYVETEIDFNVWSPLAVITPKTDKLGKYIFYAFQSTMLQAQCDVYSNANTQKNLGMNTIDNLHLPFPSYEEAEVIASFLDYETAQIDTLIEKQQTLIQLLKEKRQAVISHAVTKGLNPDASMKESGVEWLGDVPEHWDIVKLSYRIKLLSGDGITSQDIEPTGQYPVYGGNGLRGYTDRYNCEGHYVLIGRQGALCGNINLAQGKFFATEHAVVVYPYQGFNISFLSEFLRFMDLGQYSVSAAQPGISVERINGLKILVPPYDEQTEIGEHIKKIMKRFEDLSTKANQQIELLQERRTALISAAVTGKIDVRGWRAAE